LTLDDAAKKQLNILCKLDSLVFCTAVVKLLFISQNNPFKN